MDTKHERLLDLRLEGDITPEQFRARSTELEDAHVAVQDQLEAARSRLSRLKDVERSKEPVALRLPRAAKAGRTLLGREKSSLKDDAPEDLRPPRRHPHCRLGL
jgi:hypothetical protein